MRVDRERDGRLQDGRPRSAKTLIGMKNEATVAAIGLYNVKIDLSATQFQRLGGDLQDHWGEGDGHLARHQPQRPEAPALRRKDPPRWPTCFTLAVKAPSPGGRALSFSTREALSELYRVDLPRARAAEAEATRPLPRLSFSPASRSPPARGRFRPASRSHGVVAAARVAPPGRQPHRLLREFRPCVVSPSPQTSSPDAPAGGTPLGPGTASPWRLRAAPARPPTSRWGVSQYREDWTFAARWMERSGIYFASSTATRRSSSPSTTRGARAARGRPGALLRHQPRRRVGGGGVHSFSLRRSTGRRA